MRRLKLALLPVAICTATACQAADVPKPYRGEWIAQFDDAPYPSQPPCKPGEFGKLETDAMIKVGPTAVEYHESGCSVAKASSSGASVRLSLRCAGEGEEWRSTELWTRFRIYGRDFLLVTSDRQKDASIYLRCK